MAATPWLTSDDLIDIVKKRISFPISQNTLSEEDILTFATHELFDSQVPEIMTYHEEFFVFGQTLPLETDKVRYQIPDRAVGMALRDVFLRSYDGNLREMTRIAPEMKSYFQQAGATNNDIYRFYVENDDIVLTNKHVFPAGQYLEVSYYLRPNSLVTTDRAAIVKLFKKTLTINNANIAIGDQVTIGSVVATVGLANNVSTLTFAKGATSADTAANLYLIVNSNIQTAYTSGTNTLTFSSKLVATTYSTLNTTGFSFQSGLSVQFNGIPSVFQATSSEQSVIDFLQTKGGHRTYKIDYELPVGSISGDTITFPASIIPTNYVVGDYVCLSGECIIPQIPSDLHSLLAEKTCARILMSIGDQAGLQSTMMKIGDLEKKQATIVDNRVEGAPIKIVNKNSLLRLQKKTRRW